VKGGDQIADKVKNVAVYKALRKKGFSKGRAASIANAPGPKKNKKRLSPSARRKSRRKKGLK
jgi:hypothetical protein